MFTAFIKKNLIPVLVTLVGCALMSPIVPIFPSGPITDVLAIAGALWTMSLMAPPPPAEL